MKPEAQQIAIAKACGWYLTETGWTSTCRINCSGGCPDCDPREHFRMHEELPDYLNDLNAMHEAEGMLFSRGVENNWREVDAYHTWLKFYVGEEDTFNADASTRAKAFLKTLNLWTDE